MKPLSLEHINSKAPYSVWLSETDGSYRFMSDAGIVFVVDFMDDGLITSGETYQLIVGNVENKKSPRDPKVRVTIVAVVEEFFIENQAALLYICETGDGKQMARSRLFSYWFEASKQERLFTAMTSILVDEEGVENAATIIIRKDNPALQLIVSEFKQTIKLLSDKPSD